MSRYAHLACKTCKRHIWLGKTVRDKDGKAAYFSIADQVTSADHTTMRAILKLLAECIGHELIVVEEGNPLYEEIITHYSEIGSDQIGGTTLEAYLRDWQG